MILGFLLDADMGGVRYIAQLHMKITVEAVAVE